MYLSLILGMCVLDLRRHFESPELDLDDVSVDAPDNARLRNVFKGCKEAELVQPLQQLSF